MNKMLFIILSGVLCSLSYADVKVGNGGMVIIRDNEVILADPFVPKTTIPNVGETMTFSVELKSYLIHVRDLLERYNVSGIDSIPVAGSGRLRTTDFWEDQIFGSDVQYRYTEELPCSDPMSVVPGTVGQLIPFACTQNRITWFKKSLFERLSLKDQALSIIHERLHAFTFEGHGLICDFISILRMMLTLQNSQFKGERRLLTQEEIEQIGRLKELSYKLGFTTRYPGRKFEQIIPFGGGLLVKYHEQATITPDVFVSIGSLVDDSNVSYGAEIINSEITDSYIKSGQVIHSKLYRTQFIDSQIENSLIYRAYGNNDTACAQGISIIDSQLWTNLILLGDNVSLNSVNITVFEGTSIAFENNVKLNHIHELLIHGSTGFCFIFPVAPLLIFTEGTIIDMTGVSDLSIKVRGEKKISGAEDLLKLKK